MFYQQSSSPQKKKEGQTKENKLRMFLKRSSEPTLNVQTNSMSSSNAPQVLVSKRDTVSYVNCKLSGIFAMRRPRIPTHFLMFVNPEKQITVEKVGCYYSGPEVICFSPFVYVSSFSFLFFSRNKKYEPNGTFVILICFSLERIGVFCFCLYVFPPASCTI